MFLPTGFIADTVRQFKSRDCMAWSHVRELQKSGISFGSHTVTHPQLRQLRREDIERELTESKKAIEEKTGHPTESFAYPFAFPQVDTEFKRIIRESLEEAGYQNGVCTIVGRASASSDPFFLERLPLNDLDDECLFRAKLRGAYDWVGSLQSVLKRTRSLAAKPFKEWIISVERA
jgi:peptidoglycan/xylan/chitin deacetylase (PgdA/CDA1 family)